MGVQGGYRHGDMKPLNKYIYIYICISVYIYIKVHTG